MELADAASHANRSTAGYRLGDNEVFDLCGAVDKCFVLLSVSMRTRLSRRASRRHQKSPPHARRELVPAKCTSTNR